MGLQPGLSYTCAEWAHDKSLAAVAADNMAVEILHPEGLGSDMPLAFHMLALRDMGMPLGEMFNLDALAADCAEDGRYAFMLSAPPRGHRRLWLAGESAGAEVGAGPAPRSRPYGRSGDRVDVFSKPPDGAAEQGGAGRYCWRWACSRAAASLQCPARPQTPAPRWATTAAPSASATATNPPPTPNPAWFPPPARWWCRSRRNISEGWVAQSMLDENPHTGWATPRA